MNEIEKMYEKCNFEKSMGVGSPVVLHPFTPEKELKLIKWLLYHELIDYLKMSYTSEEGGILDISIKCMSGYSYKNDDDDDFDIALASLINGLWQDLTEEEKQQIKEILE